jgi:hypothetical protein
MSAAAGGAEAGSLPDEATLPTRPRALDGPVLDGAAIGAANRRMVGSRQGYRLATPDAAAAPPPAEAGELTAAAKTGRPRQSTDGGAASVPTRQPGGRPGHGRARSTLQPAQMPAAEDPFPPAPSQAAYELRAGTVDVLEVRAGDELREAEEEEPPYASSRRRSPPPALKSGSQQWLDAVLAASPAKRAPQSATPAAPGPSAGWGCLHAAAVGELGGTLTPRRHQARPETSLTAQQLPPLALPGPRTGHREARASFGQLARILQRGDGSCLLPPSATTPRPPVPPAPLLAPLQAGAGAANSVRRAAVNVAGGHSPVRGMRFWGTEPIAEALL